MNKLVLESGKLNIEDLLENNPSIKAMLEDNIITQEEKDLQFKKVISILCVLEEKCDEEQLELIRRLLSEISALIMVSQICPSRKD